MKRDKDYLKDGYLAFILILVILVIAANIKIVPQAHAYVIERLGTYQSTWGVGIHLLVPVIDKVFQKLIFDRSDLLFDAADKNTLVHGIKS